MARTTPPPASRYDGLGVGPRLAYTYENQTGVPVDGTNEALRTYSPFTITIVPPDPLGTSSTGSSNVLSFSAAAASTGSNNTSAAATGLLVSGPATTYSATQVREAASAARPAGLGLPPTSVLADAYTAADIRVQRDTLNRMAAYPLTLLVNPTDMSRTFERIQSYQARTRYGYVYQVWGEQLLKVSFSGSTAGFVAGSTRGYQALASNDTGSPSGYQWGARKDSAAWQNFSALVQFYRNNGYIYDTLGRSEAHLMVGAVRITYDDIVYEGHIDSLNFEFSEDSPHRVQFSMEFTATSVLDQSRAAGNVTPMSAPTSVPAGLTDLLSLGTRRLIPAPGGVDTNAIEAGIWVGETAAAAAGAVAAGGRAVAGYFARRETSSTPLGDYVVDPTSGSLA